MRGSEGTPGQWRRKPVCAVVVAVLGLVLAACSSGGAHHSASAKSTVKPVSRASLAAAAIQISPGSGSQDADRRPVLVAR